MKIGIIGAGQIGGTLARRFTSLGHQVFVANSRGPETLAGLARETGATPVSVTEAARSGDVVIVTIPQKNVPKLPADLFAGASPPAKHPINKPRKRSHRKVNFEDLQKHRGRIGRLAEEHALKWEEQRLGGAGLGHLVNKIKDRRDRPGFGYDFESYTAVDKARLIEVKAVARLADGHRFFLSDNERQVSSRKRNRSSYYFYLVLFDGKGVPDEVTAVRANELYPNADLVPACYVVRFDIATLGSSM